MLPNPQFLADLVTFTEEMLNGKLHFCVVTAVKCDFEMYILKGTFLFLMKLHYVRLMNIHRELLELSKAGREQVKIICHVQNLSLCF